MYSAKRAANPAPAPSLTPLSRPVDQDRDAAAHGFRLDELQALLVTRLAEQALSASEDDRKDHQTQLVDEIVLQQRLSELPAAVDDDVAILFALELRHRLDHIAVEHGRVAPRWIAQRRRDDVLRHRVELLGELALPRRPGFGESFVCDPSKQQS